MWSLSTWNSTCGRYILVLITAPINQTYLYIAMHIPYGRGEVRLFTPFFSLFLFSLPTALCFVFSYPFVIMPPFYSFYGCNQLLPNIRVSIGCLMFHTASNASYGIEPAAIGQCQPLLTHQHLIHIADTDMFPPLLYFLVSSFLYIFFTSWLVVSCITMYFPSRLRPFSYYWGFALILLPCRFIQHWQVIQLMTFLQPSMSHQNVLHVVAYLLSLLV